jgi:photosystem II stability/assembly factor-like uncharacterized protein
MSRASHRIGLPLLAVAIVSVSGWTVATTSTAAVATRAAIDSTILRMYRWRSVGPERGGRSDAVSGVRGRPQEGYFGATGGGLWKTTDGGESWMPVTDGQLHSASVGAVAVSETSPDVVWIGMGESYIRGNILPGDGVYKSIDAGKTWTHVGFGNSDAISMIRIHPKNPDVVFVADFGKYGVPSEERGIFKTADGGKTWRKVLYRDDKTGGADIAIDQTNPDVMYAALWEAYRNEWTMSSGGPGCGLYKSTDGGETWKEITRNPGLPSGMDGKIGVAVSGADPNRVYALIENDNGGLFSSDDAGATWKLVNPSRQIRQRAFYYTRVVADPKNKDLIYLLNVGTFRSTDGGKTMQQFAGGDSHDLWIDPDNSDHVLHASDGGGAITMNASSPSRTWSSRNYPTPQLYHVIATSGTPYFLCGAQQDATSFCISSANANTNAGGGRGGRGGNAGGGRGGAPAGPASFNVGGSEDGYMAQDPLDPDIFYVGTNANGGGFLNKENRRTGDNREVSPYPRMFSGEESAVIKERWQWTYPIVFSTVDQRALYVGSQHLWKTTNGGQDWTMISPDLTRHDPKTMGPSGGPITRDMNGPEVYAVIFSIAPSKKDANVIWTGSDDGLVYVTKTGGLPTATAWTNVTPKGMPDFGRVSQIDASAFDAATAYVSVRRPLLNDRAPYIFRTHDFGKTWTTIVSGIAADDYVNAVRADPYRKGLLYAGTNRGFYVSYDDGDNWQSLALNIAETPVTDIVVQPNDVALSTMGRGFYVLDNINPLRWANEASTARDAFLFAPVPAVRSSSPASIQYWLKHPVQSIKIEVTDSSGKIVRTLTGGTAAPPPDTSAAGRGGRGGGRGGFGGNLPLSTSAGIQTTTWDLRYPNAVGFPGMILWGGGLTGPAAPPGTYKLTLMADGVTQSQSLVVKRNPLFSATDADLRAQFELASRIRDKVTEANTAVINIRDLKSQITDRLSKSQDPKLKTAGDKLAADLSAVESEIYQVKNQAGQDPLNYPIKLNNRLSSLLTGVVESGDGKPIGNAPVIFRDLSAELKVQTDRLARVLASEVPAFNTVAKTAGVPVLVVPKAGPVM